jgi:hypothetical protein
MPGQPTIFCRFSEVIEDIARRWLAGKKTGFLLAVRQRDGFDQLPFLILNPAPMAPSGRNFNKQPLSDCQYSGLQSPGKDPMAFLNLALAPCVIFKSPSLMFFWLKDAHP